MRSAHDGKPPRAVVARRDRWYRLAMQTTHRLPRTLRYAAAAVLLAGLGTWFATGRHLGWTQTSVVSIQKDEITGIDYPVRRDAFVAGVEVPAAAAGLAAALVGFSFVLGRRRSPSAVAA